MPVLYWMYWDWPLVSQGCRQDWKASTEVMLESIAERLVNTEGR